MPELPEVESMRQILLTLKSSPDDNKKRLLQMQRVKDNPPKVFVTDEEITMLNDNCVVLDVTRKGKLLCMELECIKPISVSNKEKEEGNSVTTTTTTNQIYLFLHMGMTGRISSPHCIPNLQELKDTTEYPPPNTYLKFTVVDPTTNKTVAEASFSDPRKFGAVELDVTTQKLDELAPDAFLEIKNDMDGIIDKLTEQSKPIKAILLDQKRVISGVGNWIADEICYQCELHPEQKFLKKDEAQQLVETLSEILQTAVACNANSADFPKHWMFHYRWERKRDAAKDFKGRKISFVKSGGRTSAIVAAIQKEHSRSSSKKVSATKKKTNANAKQNDNEEQGSQKATATKKKAGTSHKRKSTDSADEKNFGPIVPKNLIKKRAPKEQARGPVAETPSKRKLTGAADEKCLGPMVPKNMIKKQTKDPVPERPRRYPRRSTS